MDFSKTFKRKDVFDWIEKIPFSLVYDSNPVKTLNTFFRPLKPFLTFQLFLKMKTSKKTSIHKKKVHTFRIQLNKERKNAISTYLLSFFSGLNIFTFYFFEAKLKSKKIVI